MQETHFVMPATTLLEVHRMSSMLEPQWWKTEKINCMIRLCMGLTLALVLVCMLQYNLPVPNMGKKYAQSINTTNIHTNLKQPTN